MEKANRGAICKLMINERARLEVMMLINKDFLDVAV